MQRLTWLGELGFLLPWLFVPAALLLAVGIVVWLAFASIGRAGVAAAGAGPAQPSDVAPALPARLAGRAVAIGLGAIILGALAVVLAGIFAPAGWAGILGTMAGRFTPVWVALIVVYALSIRYKRRLGLYGRLFDSPIGMIGFGLVMFWLFTALFGHWIAPFDPLEQVPGMRFKLPGTPVRGMEDAWFLLGGDHLGRDVFSRMVMGSRTVLAIAPAATAFAFMTGITLGVPAGYFGGRYDTVMSFLANLVLAFPVIMLFYLLVTPEIRATGLPVTFAAVLFLFPIVFFSVLWNSRFHTRPRLRWILLIATWVIGFWAYSGLAFNADPLGVFYMDPNLLNIFVSVVFVNSPTVFRIVRGLTLDIKTRDYVAAAQTRGERPWYIMLWEILPNARGPLIVDFCLRIGYTTILLGTLGFFGLGVSPESADWGMTINEGRKLLLAFPHPAIPPALALMSLVLGLNLLADGLREESLKD
ncbi:MAG: ABC transporter permease [Alphaproteobacteria bacterium]|nr:MAG: ABC transporter permease [Alphaproteobacteria bacterium]